MSTDKIHLVQPIGIKRVKGFIVTDMGVPWDESPVQDCYFESTANLHLIECGRACDWFKLSPLELVEGWIEHHMRTCTARNIIFIRRRESV